MKPRDIPLPWILFGLVYLLAFLWLELAAGGGLGWHLIMDFFFVLWAIRLWRQGRVYSLQDGTLRPAWPELEEETYFGGVDLAAGPDRTVRALVDGEGRVLEVLPEGVTFTEVRIPDRDRAFLEAHRPPPPPGTDRDDAVDHPGPLLTTRPAVAGEDGVPRYPFNRPLTINEARAIEGQPPAQLRGGGWLCQCGAQTATIPCAVCGGPIR